MKRLLSAGVFFLLSLGRNAYLFFRIGCNNMLGCVPDPWDAAFSFYNYFHSIRTKPALRPL